MCNTFTVLTMNWGAVCIRVGCCKKIPAKGFTLHTPSDHFEASLDGLVCNNKETTGDNNTKK